MKSLLNKVFGRKACKFIKMRPQHRCFPVNIAKFLMISCEYCEISKNTYFEGHLPTAASELTLGRTFFLDSRFQHHPDLVMLQKYQPLSNHRFKHNLEYILFLNLIAKLSFEP